MYPRYDNGCLPYALDLDIHLMSQTGPISTEKKDNQVHQPEIKQVSRVDSPTIV